MSNTLALIAALAGMSITALFNIFVFNMSRTSPNNILVRSDVLASMTALMMTSLIVFAFAFVMARMYAITGSIAISVVASVASFAVLTFLAWFIFGTKARAATTVPSAGKLPGAA